VTVLSSDDPVRVFESFATLDLLSSGRAEIMAGRGSFIESFPLFGYDLGVRVITHRLIASGSRARVDVSSSRAVGTGRNNDSTDKRRETAG